MLEAVFRRILLSFSSYYLKNIDVNDLSLWGGNFTLQNLELNLQAITALLGMEMISVTKGSIKELSMSIPWTRLTSSSTEIIINQLVIELTLGEHSECQGVPEVDDIEESLLKKIVANLILEIHDLKVVIKTPKNSHNYITILTFDHFKWITTDKNWKPEFINPYQIAKKNSAFVINKLMQIDQMSMRVISGASSEFISESVIAHKNEQCRNNCPLCCAFKTSSYYTLLRIISCDLNFYHSVSTENGYSHDKTSVKQTIVSKVDTKIANDICFTTPLILKLNFKDGARVVQDMSDLSVDLSKGEEPQPLYKVPKTESSWYEWGRDWVLSPFVCAPAQPKEIKYVKTTSSKTNLAIKDLTLHLKLPHEIQNINSSIMCKEIEYEKTQESTTSSDQVYRPNSNSNLMQGEIKEAVASFTMGKNVIDIKAGHVGYKGVEDILSYGINSYEIAVDANKVISGELLEGKVNSTDGLKLTNSTRLFNLDAEYNDTFLLNNLIFYLRTAYFRAVGEEASNKTLEEIMNSHQEEVKNQTGTVAHEQTISQLKSHVSDLSAQLAAAEWELSQLRSKLAATAVSTKSTLSSLLGLPDSDILASSESAVYQGVSVIVVITKTDLYMLTNEGRVMYQHSVGELRRLELRGSDEILISFQNEVSLPFSLLNREAVTSAIKEICQ